MKRMSKMRLKKDGETVVEDSGLVDSPFAAVAAAFDNEEKRMSKMRLKKSGREDEIASANQLRGLLIKRMSKMRLK
jgi:hypothetical protein